MRDTRVLAPRQRDRPSVRRPTSAEVADRMPPSLTVSHVREQIPGAVYVGHGAPRAGLAASLWSARAKTARIGEGADPAERIWAFHNLLLGDGALRAALPELRGTTVACRCRRSDEARRPNNLCHADVIAVWLDYFSDATLRWLGENGLTRGWADELDDRVRDLLGGKATGPLG